MEKQEKKRLYYGWICTLLVSLTMFGSSGILNFGAANIIQELIVVRGWDPALVTTAYAVRAILGLAMPLVGWATQKFGPRRVIGWTTVVTAGFLVACAYVNSPLVFIIVYGVAVSFAMMFNDNVGCHAVVANWWRGSRLSQHAGLVNAGSALGGVAFPVFMAWSLQVWGWKTTLWILAALLLVITGIPQLIWLRDHPEEVGQTLEDGNPPEKSGMQKLGEELNANAKARNLYVSPVDWEVKDAIRTKELWMNTIAWACKNWVFCTIMYYSVTMFTMQGMDSITASSVISLKNIATIIGSFVLVKFIGKMGPRNALLLCDASAIICPLLCLLVNGNYWIAAEMGILYGTISCFLQPAQTTLISNYYGPKNFAQITGSYMGILMVCSGFTNTLIGIILSKTGSLDSAFIIASVVGAVGFIMTLSLRPPKLPEKYQKLLDEQAAGN